MRGLTLLELLLASALGFVIILAVGNLDMTRIRLTQEASNTAGFQATAQRLLFQMKKFLEQADRIHVICNGDPGSPGPSCGATNETNIQVRFPEPDTNCLTPPCGAVTVVCSCTGAVPQPCCFDMAQNYRWVQYLFQDTDANGAPDAVLFFNDAAYDGSAVYDCAQVNTLAKNFDNLILTFENESKAPPGGEPFTGGLFVNDDNNILSIEVRAQDPPGSGVQRATSTQATIRANAYTDLLPPFPLPGDSGTGMEAPGVVGGVSPPPLPPCS